MSLLGSPIVPDDTLLLTIKFLAGMIVGLVVCHFLDQLSKKMRKPLMETYKAEFNMDGNLKEFELSGSRKINLTDVEAIDASFSIVKQLLASGAYTNVDLNKVTRINDDGSFTVIYTYIDGNLISKSVEKRINIMKEDKKNDKG